MVHRPGAHAHHGLDKSVSISVYLHGVDIASYPRRNMIAVEINPRRWDNPRHSTGNIKR